MPYGRHPMNSEYYPPSYTPWGYSGGFSWSLGKSYYRFGTNTPVGKQYASRVPYYVLVSRQVRGPWDGTFYYRGGKRFKNRPLITVLRLKRRWKKVRTVSQYRGSNPNVLSYEEVSRGAIPSEVALTGRARWQEWTFKGSPFAAIAPLGEYLCTDVSQYVGSSWGGPTHPSRESAIASARESNTTKLYDQLKSQDFNAAVTLAQIGETSKTISDVAVMAAKLLVAFKKGDVRSAQKVLATLAGSKKAVSSSYLQYTYGIAPLLGDIDGAARALAELPSMLSYVKVKAKTKRELPLYELILEDTDTAYTAIRITGSIELKSLANFKVVGVASRDASLVGISKTSLLEVGWELIPYSFVVDWLLPIGNYLESLSATAGLEIDWMTETIVVREHVTVVRELKNRERVVDGSTRINSGGGSFAASSSRVKVTRSFTSLAPPVIPVVKNPFSGKHLLNAAALITQLFRGK